MSIVFLLLFFLKKITQYTDPHKKKKITRNRHTILLVNIVHRGFSKKSIFKEGKRRYVESISWNGNDSIFPIAKEYFPVNQGELT